MTATLSDPRSILAAMTATPVEDDFVKLADPFRRELLAHCYRMLGSVHDAEDLVQETYLRAWRAYDKFEGRSSLRTWLYTIATRTCLTALESRGKRPLPTDLASPQSEPGELIERTEVPWLEPLPDDAKDPASIAAARESTRLALIAAMQHLPPNQRAVLVLREVLQWKAAEVADALDMSVAAVNSALQRARAQIDKVAPQHDEVAEPSDEQQKELLQKWVAAFENYDMKSMVELFTSDSVWEMPPFLNWTTGPANIVALMEAYCPAKAAGDQRLVPTTANGQPAFGLYMRGEDGVHRPFQLQVLSMTAQGVDHTTVFFDLSLFPKFGLPETV